MNKCTNCQHCHTDNAVDLVCRRYPPKATVTITPPQPPSMQPGRAIMSVFPPVNKDMVCGEYIAKPKGTITKLPSKPNVN